VLFSVIFYNRSNVVPRALQSDSGTLQNYGALHETEFPQGHDCTSTPRYAKHFANPQNEIHEICVNIDKAILIKFANGKHRNTLYFIIKQIEFR
jgi:hypothetical protein